MYPGAALSGDATCDVCIIGGGIAGLSVAYFLTQAGKKIILIDDGPTAGGETCRTSAHLTYYNDDGLAKIEKLHGTEGLQLATDSHKAAVDTIEKIVRDEKIDCDLFRTNAYLFISPGGEGMDFLQAELDAARRVGQTDGHFVDRAPLPDFDTGRCLCYPNQAQFHPIKYLRGVAAAIIGKGGRIHNNSHASEIAGGDNAHVTISDGRTIRAESIVVATNSPINDLVAIHTKQSPNRTYVVGFRIPRAVPKHLYWDTMDPYHYVRLQEFDATDDVLLAGGEDHKTGQANDPAHRYAAIERWTRERFPAAKDILFHWSGQTMEPFDGLAYIGRNPLDEPNVFIATGDSGMGLTHGTIAGLLLRDLILGRKNPWEKLYDPHRTTLNATGDYAKENLNVAKGYTHWLTPGEVTGESEIAPDTGAILRRGAKKIAVYRDKQGRLHERSAVCSHLGCIVAWNGTERTWDCPCHGARYTPGGKVVNGPANHDLAHNHA